MTGRDELSVSRFRRFRNLVIAWFVWDAVLLFIDPLLSAILGLIGIIFAIWLYFRWLRVRGTTG